MNAPRHRSENLEQVLSRRKERRDRTLMLTNEFMLQGMDRLIAHNAAVDQVWREVQQEWREEEGEG